MVKTTLLYGHPADPDAFEKYYSETHMPIAVKMKVEKAEFTKFISTADGNKPPYYRMAELYFTDIAQMQETMATEEAKAAAADLPNFSTGGVTIIIGAID